MAESSKVTYFDIKNLRSKTKPEMYVNCETTSDPESREILDLLENRELRTYYSIKSEKNKTLDDKGVEFYTRASFEKKRIETTVNKISFEVTLDDISQIF